MGWKSQTVATKASQKATAYLALAYMRIKLLMMLTVAKTSELPEGRAWRVKNALQEKYKPDGILAIAKLKKRINSLTMKQDWDLSDLLDELAAIEHEYSGTQPKQSIILFWCWKLQIMERTRNWSSRRCNERCVAPRWWEAKWRHCPWKWDCTG